MLRRGPDWSPIALTPRREPVSTTLCTERAAVFAIGTPIAGNHGHGGHPARCRFLTSDPAGEGVNGVGRHISRAPRVEDRDPRCCSGSLELDDGTRNRCALNQAS